MNNSSPGCFDCHIFSISLKLTVLSVQLNAFYSHLYAITIENVIKHRISNNKIINTLFVASLDIFFCSELGNVLPVHLKAFYTRLNTISNKQN